MKRLIVLLVAGFFLLLTGRLSNAQTISGTPHNLSSSGTGTVKSNTSEICVFCHTPHSQTATTLLWNRNNSTASYTVYSSSWMNQTAGQPGADSKLCLSCHDGTVGFNSLINGPGDVSSVTMTGSTHMTGADSIGTDLTNDHPVGIVYQTALTADASGFHTISTTGGTFGSNVYVANGGNKVPLSGSSSATASVECTSCHNPHNNVNGDFLRVSNNSSALCLTCHNK